MEQRIVARENTKYIYWIKDNNNAFYLSIPNTKEVGIIINLLKDANDEDVKRFPDIKDKVIVTPIISSEISLAVKENNAEYFNQLDSIISNAINLSHQILTYNKLDVKNSISLNNNKEYEMFNIWFVKKYGGRVSLIEIEENNNQTLNTPLSTDQTSQLPENFKKTEPIIEETMELDKEDAPSERQKSLGFVSYVLLGVVVAVASLIFLYLII